jgi:hypothetical protein
MSPSYYVNKYWPAPVSKNRWNHPAVNGTHYENTFGERSDRGPMIGVPEHVHEREAWQGVRRRWSPGGRPTRVPSSLGK